MAARERLIALVKALNEYTDEEHPLSAGKLCAILAQHGIAANRRSIYADVAALNRMGWRIESTTRGYYGYAAYNACAGLRAVYGRGYGAEA